MKLFLLTQDANGGYDTYDSCVVSAESEEDAKKMNPNGGETTNKDEDYGTWTTLKNVDVEYIGEAKEGSEPEVICSSFNAG